jgi:hypothetical protein
MQYTAVCNAAGREPCKPAQDGFYCAAASLRQMACGCNQEQQQLIQLLLQICMVRIPRTCCVCCLQCSHNPGEADVAFDAQLQQLPPHIRRHLLLDVTKHMYMSRQASPSVLCLFLSGPTGVALLTCEWQHARMTQRLQRMLHAQQF